MEERDWPEAELQQYETLYELIDALPGSTNLITALLADIDDFYVVDPSMGVDTFSRPSSRKSPTFDRSYGRKLSSIRIAIV